MQVDRIAMYYERRGTGEPLLLIPGLGADISMFRRIISDLARRHQVVAFDNRGAGLTEKPDISYTIAIMA